MTSEHWLFRLSAQDWLAAADKEIELAAGQSRSRRKMLTHVRRGAGMALNGVLVAAEMASVLSDEDAATVWGRSYLDHLRALASRVPDRTASDAPPLPIEVPAEVCAAAKMLVELPLMDAQGLVRLGGGHGPAVTRALAQGGLMLQWAKAYTEARAAELATL